MLVAANYGLSDIARAQDAAVGDAPRAVAFPRDDGPHDQLIEWWYYAGHLFTADGDRYGFEFVIFKAQVAGLTGYASHFAVTDNEAGIFQYDQRRGFAADDSSAKRETGFALQVDDWSMTGVGGDDHLVAAMTNYAIDLQVTSEKPPVLHDGDGYIDYGGGQGSYYYSRTRMSVEGVLTINGVAQPITGETPPPSDYRDCSESLTGVSLRTCPVCADGHMIVTECLRRARPYPALPDTS